MPHDQLDLFSGVGFPAQGTAGPVSPREIDSASLTDALLLDALEHAEGRHAALLAAAAGQRRLPQAIPALASLCRRFKGFGLRHPVREQQAALAALAAIGGADARDAVARILADGVVAAPGLGSALAAAAQLGCRVPAVLLQDCLRHSDPDIRAAACRSVRPGQGAEPLLLDLLNDLNQWVADAAACALGRLGCAEARPALMRVLISAPNAEAIAAIAQIADEESLVVLGRLARSLPRLRDEIIDALEAIEHPRSAAVLAALRRAGP